MQANIINTPKSTLDKSDSLLKKKRKKNFNNFKTNAQTFKEVSKTSSNNLA